MKTHLWLRAETKAFERRTPLTPEGTKTLLAAGHQVTVESSADRIFEDQAYLNVGCQLAESQSWKSAPQDAVVLGLKELEQDDFALKHEHIYFGHAYKGQAGANDLLQRFKKGHGKLYDLEYLINDQGRRVAAFGYWAGFAGAAAVIGAWIDLKQERSFSPLHDFDHQDEWINHLKSHLGTEKPSVIVVGAKGRCGTGALDLLTKLGIDATAWDFEETKNGGPFNAIAKHDIFINTALIAKKIPPFITEETLIDKPLKLICDVSCDPTSDINPIPLYHDIGSWPKPVQSLELAQQTRHILAVDNLPSLLPLESSQDFSAQLLPHLLDFAQNKTAPVWSRSLEYFNNYSAKI